MDGLWLCLCLCIYINVRRCEMQYKRNPIESLNAVDTLSAMH
jgi:hypothetical protein